MQQNKPFRQQSNLKGYFDPLPVWVRLEIEKEG